MEGVLRDVRPACERVVIGVVWCGVGCMSGVGRLKYVFFTVENYMSHYRGHG